MPYRAPWTPDLQVGHELIDAQHQGLLAQCHRLADLCEAAPGEESNREFDLAFEQLKRLVHEHFEAEAALLASAGVDDLEDHRTECDEFDYLATEVATTDKFDRVELQRFLALWCLGHISGSVEMLRELLAGDPPA